MLVNNEAFNLLLHTTHFFFSHLIQHSATGSNNNSYTFQVFLRGSKNNPEMHNQTQQHFGHHLFDTRCNGARHWLQARLTHCCVHLRCGLCHKYIGWMVVQGVKYWKHQKCLLCVLEVKRFTLTKCPQSTTGAHGSGHVIWPHSIIVRFLL